MVHKRRYYDMGNNLKICDYDKNEHYDIEGKNEENL